MEKNYKVYENTTFDERTPHAVCEILSNAIHSKHTQRLRLFYGDTKTGRDWMEEHDTIGYIGRSTGSVKIPLLISRANAYGGSAILDDRILRITCDGRELYKHPAYHQPDIVQKDKEVFFNGEMWARFDSIKQAENYVEFMRGNRNTKGGK